MSPAELLKEMVSVESMTPDVAGVNRVQKIVQRELAELGFTIEYKANPDPSVKTGELLIATLKGRDKRFVTFVSHADTVLGHAVVGPYELKVDSGFARGPGVIDNKGGLVVALDGLNRYLGKLSEHGEDPHYSLRFVCSPNEEGGSTGFHDEFKNCAADSVLVLGFEPALDNGSIVESRRGNRWYQIKVTGHEAHAGRCKGEQINAAHDLAIKIGKLNRLNNAKLGLSVNVAQIEAGRDRFNVVCGFANCKLDTRFSSFANRNRLHRKIEKILMKPQAKSKITGQTSTTTYTIEDDCPPFSSTRNSRSLIKQYLRIVSHIEGRTVLAEKAGGAGDVNYMSREDVIVLDGLGPIGGNMHTKDEFIELKSLETRARALSQFLEIAPSHIDGKFRLWSRKT